MAVSNHAADDNLTTYVCSNTHFVPDSDTGREIKMAVIEIVQGMALTLCGICIDSAVILLLISALLICFVVVIYAFLLFVKSIQFVVQPT